MGKERQYGWYDELLAKLQRLFQTASADISRASGKERQDKLRQYGERFAAEMRTERADTRQEIYNILWNNGNQELLDAISKALAEDTKIN